MGRFSPDLVTDSWMESVVSHLRYSYVMLFQSLSKRIENFVDLQKHVFLFAIDPIDSCNKQSCPLRSCRSVFVLSIIVIVLALVRRAGEEDVGKQKKKGKYKRWEIL